MKYVLLSLFVILVADQEPRQQDGKKELLGPRQDRFTKESTTRECGHRFCWSPVQLQHFQHEGKQ